MDEKSEAYHEGYNRYWYGGQGCPYKNGTTAWADWWEGWEASAEEDSVMQQVTEDFLMAQLEV